MDILDNLQAFLAVADTGGFSAAGRRLGVSTSVVAKRVTQLEARIGLRLFQRSTRALRLTEQGAAYLGRARDLVAGALDLLAPTGDPRSALVDHLRVKAPTSFTVSCLIGAFSQFQTENPDVRLDVVLLDRPVDPVAEGFDVAISAFPQSFGGVVDEPLCRLPRIVCASPAYLHAAGAPSHPRELLSHRCLSFLPTGPTWTFMGPRGAIDVQVRPVFSSNEGQMLARSAAAGNGIAMLSRYLAAEAMANGALVQTLEDFPVPDLWIKAMIPARKAGSPAVSALLRTLQAALDDGEAAHRQ